MVINIIIESFHLLSKSMGTKYTKFYNGYMAMERNNKLQVKMASLLDNYSSP
jgi:hypothetical protein